jgi:uncharacterized protein YndB with AHSA1/START domain
MRDPAVPDRIEREILIDAPRNVCGRWVTEARHVGSWFAEAAEIDLTASGQRTLSWQEHGRFHAVVERVEPPRFLYFRWARRAGMEPRKGSSTLVQFSLNREGDRT